ncbi:integral membrane protein, partial [Clarias magur]
MTDCPKTNSTKEYVSCLSSKWLKSPKDNQFRLQKYVNLISRVLYLQVALRTTLFSFYFGDVVAANHLSTPLYWLLYCCPVCLQFFTLSLINLYFTQVVLKVRDLFSIEPRKGLCIARCVYAAMSVVFLCVNVVSASLGERGKTGVNRNKTWTLVLVRVLVNDLLFIIEAVCLATSLLLLTRFSPTTSPYLNSKGTSLCRTAVLGAGVILLFLSRACYNLTALILSQNYKVESFDFDWYNISDQADLRNDLGDMGYIIFGAILFIWELLPTSLLILIFRVPRPTKEMKCIPVNTRASRSYFFDDPREIDGDPSATWSYSIRPNS